LFTASALYADCNQIGTPGNDHIICNKGRTPPDPNGTINANLGDDQVIVAGNTVVGALYGDGDPFVGNGGNDHIAVNGTANGDIYGDLVTGNGGDDRIIVNGTATTLIQADGVSGNGGRDEITINGSVARYVAGDVAPAGGADTITIRGAVGESVYGDYVTIPAGVGGNDRILISGMVGGSVYGDSLGVNGGEPAVGGDDTVTLQNGANIGGVIDGGPGSDTLVFNFSGLSSSDAAAVQAAVDAASSSGSLTVSGHTYVWQNVEHLVNDSH
jgi:hypothetical protein